MMSKRYAVFAALLTVTAGFTLPANAQQYKAKFTLPFEARWGAAVLPAGDYTLWTDTVLATPFIHVQSNGHTYSILAGPVDQTQATDKGGHINVVEVNGTQVVTKFEASLIGKQFSFAIPKSVKKEAYGVAAMKHTEIPMSASR